MTQEAKLWVDHKFSVTYDSMPKRILLLSLETFRAAGGIQRMSRTLVHSLHQLCEKNSWSVDLYALNDRQFDLLPQYLPSSDFKGFDRNKTRFVLQSIRKGMNADIVLLSHINLSFLGLILRLLNPKCKIWLITHGIEVWQPLKRWKKAIWKIADQIICVSSFTKNKVIELHQADPDRCLVLNNILDPFIRLPMVFDKPESLLKRYHLTADHQVVFTLTRIAATEQFKGYELVIQAVSRIKDRLPNLKYILAGPCDEAEKLCIQKLIAANHLENNFILTGFVEEAELADHFLLADLFVLPSKKEGFGIVFIEAMAFGLPVICGNVDGSTDAVRNENMGSALDPDDIDELERTILLKLQYPLTNDERRNIQRQCMEYFNGQDYRDALENLIKEDGAIA